MEERRQQWDRIGRNRSQTTNIANGPSATPPTTSTSTTSTTTATIPTTTPTPTTTSTPTPVIPDLTRRLEKPFDKPGHGIRMQGNLSNFFQLVDSLNNLRKFFFSNT